MWGYSGGIGVISLMGDELLEHTHHIMHYFSLELLTLLSNEGFQQYVSLLLHLFGQDMGKVGVLGVSRFIGASMGNHKN